MSKRGSWGSMADRVARPPEPGPPPPQTPSSLKHCWVTDEHGRLPGLLLEWRQTVDGFQGRVVRPVHETGEGWLLVEEWLPAHVLGLA
jgi:hypothetical protein